MMNASLTRHFCVTCFKIVALDPVFHRANLTVGTQDFERILQFCFLFCFFIMDAIQGRNLKVGLDEDTGLTCKLADIQELNIFFNNVIACTARTHCKKS